jgi:hypothetical protein
MKAVLFVMHTKEEARRQTWEETLQQEREEGTPTHAHACR